MTFDIQLFATQGTLNILNENGVASLVSALDARYFTGTTTDFIGATAESAGKKGMVPAPAVDDANKILYGNGAWGAFPVATDTVNGITKLYNAVGDEVDGAITPAAVKAAVSAVYKYKGSVATYDALPSSGNIVGDVYNVEAADTTHNINAGDNVAWNGTGWDQLAGIVNLSNYVQFTDDYVESITLANKILTVTPSAGDAWTVDLASQYVLPEATASTLGGVKIGTNINVESDGTISVATADGTTTLGLVKAGGNVSISNGVVSVATATDEVLGVAKFGNGLVVDAGEVVLAAATDSQLGGVKIGTNIDLNQNTISVATANGSTTLGLVKAGNNVSIVNGEVSVALASSSTFGVVKAGTNISIVEGVASIATATDAVLGLAKFGTGLNVADGNVTLNAATDNALGGVKVGTNIDVQSDGTISVATANGSTTLGLTKAGTNVSVVDGAINVATATTSTLGLVQVGTGIDVADGVISVSEATSLKSGLMSKEDKALFDSITVLEGADITNAVNSVTFTR